MSAGLGIFVVVNLTLGQLPAGVTYSDILVFPLLLILFAIRKSISKKTLLFIAVVLSILFFGALGMVSRKETPALFYFFLLVIKLVLVLSMLYYSRFTGEKPNLRVIDLSFGVGLLGALAMSALNWINGSPAFYGPGQIPATPFPAQSGFGLMTMSAYFLWRAGEEKNFVFHGAFVLSTICLFLVLSAASVVTSLLVAIAYLVLVIGVRGIIVFLTLGIVTFIGRFGAEIDWGSLLRRVIRLPEKVAYRYEKVGDNIEGCADIACLAFGKGIGYHSYLAQELKNTSSLLNFDNLPFRLFYELGITGVLVLFLIPTALTLRSWRKFTPAHWVFIFSAMVYSMSVEFLFVGHMAGQFAALSGLLFPASVRRDEVPIAHRSVPSNVDFVNSRDS